MKKRHFLFFTFAVMCFNMFGTINDAQQINLEHRHQHDNHIEHYTPADMPEVYYDSNNQQIILVADGIVNYYDVEIVSQSTMFTVISTQADGYGDTIDVSSLPDDDYTIVITSPYNNVYEGHFTNY